MLTYLACILLGAAALYGFQLLADRLHYRRMRKRAETWQVRHVDSEVMRLVERGRVVMGEDPEIEVRPAASVETFVSEDCAELEGRVRWDILGRA